MSKVLTIQTLVEDKLKSLYTEIINNKDYILHHELNVEHLHEFRVAVRKVRAILGVLKHYFEPEIQNICKNEFKKIGHQTNEIRDLDVYIQTLNLYQQKLSKNKKERFQRIIDLVTTKRENEYQKLKLYLESSDFGKGVQTLLEIKSVENFSSLSLEPVDVEASKKLMSTYEKILKKSFAIEEKSTPFEYHSLRVGFKKFRYLIELFEPMYEKEAYKEIVFELKKVQNILGEFNDAEVQIEKFDALQKVIQPKEVELHLIKTFVSELKKQQNELKIRFEITKDVIFNERYKNNLLKFLQTK